MSTAAKASRAEAARKRGDRLLPIVALAPLALLLLLAILRFTMEIVLEPGIAMTWVKITVLPIWIPAVILTPAALAGLAVKHLGAPTAAWCVAWLATLAWGTWYLLPWICERWGPFLAWVEEMGPV